MRIDGQPTSISVVSPGDVALRHRIHRFWYDVYVTEMGRVQPEADHGAKVSTDSLDRTATVLAAIDGPSGRVVGTVRLNFGDVGGLGSYEELYDLARLSPQERASLSITTRLMVAPEVRGTSLVVRLIREAFRVVRSRRVTHDFIDCNEHLVPLFARLGYRPWARAIHPWYGEVQVMRLDLNDQRLRDAKSLLVDWRRAAVQC
jgi:predicted GNAT family N-acyltransferase